MEANNVDAALERIQSLRTTIESAKTERATSSGQLTEKLEQLKGLGADSIPSGKKLREQLKKQRNYLLFTKIRLFLNNLKILQIRRFTGKQPQKRYGEILTEKSIFLCPE